MIVAKIGNGLEHGFVKHRPSSLLITDKSEQNGLSKQSYIFQKENTEMQSVDLVCLLIKSLGLF